MPEGDTRRRQGGQGRDQSVAEFPGAGGERAVHHDGPVERQAGPSHRSAHHHRLRARRGQYPQTERHHHHHDVAGHLAGRVHHDLGHRSSVSDDDHGPLGRHVDDGGWHVDDGGRPYEHDRRAAQQVKAVVLVGGEGTRLRPLTYTTPKQLLPVVEVPLLERVLVHLAAAGVDEAILSLGYRPDAFVTAYPDSVAAGIRLSYAVEPEPLDTAGAIAFAARHGGVDETFVAVNGDVLTDVDVGDLVRRHRHRQALATIHLTAVEDPSRFGVVATDDDGRVLAFVEKPPPGQAPSNLINAGTYILEPEVLALIPADQRVSIERRTFPELVDGGRLYGVASE